MRVSFNRLFFEQTSFDSSAPSGLAAVLHTFAEAGQYMLKFLRDDIEFDRYAMTVLEEAPRPEAPPTHVRVDIGRLRERAPKRQAGEVGGHPAEEQAREFTVVAKGFALFTSSRKEGSYAILAEKMEKRAEPMRPESGKQKAPAGSRPERFDSRTLEAADVFAVTLIRPGGYALTNSLTGARGKITVAYPTIGKEPYRPPGPVTVHCTAKGFVPDTIDLQAAQGIIFRFGVPSRIQIDLVTPNDGPRKMLQLKTRRTAPVPELRPRPIARWRKTPDGGDAG